MKQFKNLSLLLAFCLLTLSAAAQTALQDKLKAISNIAEIKPLDSGEFAEKYVAYFTQPLDHDRPELGSFRQRVIISHVGFDRPTVIVTEGYGAGYAVYPRYREELSKIFNTNMVFVEYRYFLESTPEPRDWQYLTAESSADDLTVINQLTCKLFFNKFHSISFHDERHRSYIGCLCAFNIIHSPG